MTMLSMFNTRNGVKIMWNNTAPKAEDRKSGGLFSAIWSLRSL
jgi:hypothetical protein